MPGPSPATPLPAPFARCLLEGEFPFFALSALARADRALTDPVYAAHKWWARRPRAVIRALILAAHLPSSTPTDAFWSLFADDSAILEGRHVGDPFSGGGTTLVEASRLGATATGTDVDPLAVRIARDELAATSDKAVSEAADALLGHLRDHLGALYPTSTEGRTPLHYFRLRRVACPACAEESLLYRSPLLARDLGRAGAVVRDGKQIAVCPACRQIHHPRAKARSFVCCRRRWDLNEGTFSRSGFVCPSCSSRHTLSQIGAAHLPDELIAVEDTVDQGRRHLRAPTAEDLAALETAAELRAAASGAIPTDSLEDVDGGRPASYGFATIADLFGDRQALMLATSLAWLSNAGLDHGVEARLELAISNSISANNRLCGYATDYGRLAPAFTGVRSYSLPVLSVELNPLHPTAGRGTIAATLRRLERSAASTVRRYVRQGARMSQREMTARRAVGHQVVCRSADRPFPSALGRCSAIITDPPYYDFIAYSDLSLLHRAWFQAGANEALGGAPIYPVGDDGHATFTRRLGRALRNAAASLQPGGVMAFTYHSPHEAAWLALGSAVAKAGLAVTAVFPVWADARSSVAHGHPGSCEWDLVWVCRPKPAPAPGLPRSIDAWGAVIGDLVEADRVSLALGLAAARSARDQP
jgi:putative DNA methylase